jgi:16S rRNA (adenine1518-N6/adenine1519-N6)-dimethyltransferase
VSQVFADPRTLLRRYGLAAKKSWGQNFLCSERVYRAIVDATVSSDSDWIVEIGAGLGTLTARLADRAIEGKVVAVERERDMLRVLEGELGHLDNVEVVPGDAMALDLAPFARWCGGPVRVCGNLPYNIASQIILHLLEQRQHVERMVVMVQREMAERLVAGPATPAYGALGVLVQTYADARLVCRAPPTAFVPPPRVESAVVRLTPLPGALPRAPIEDARLYGQVVHAAFGLRRKTLRNALGQVFGAAGEAALAAAGIDPGRRGETLDIEEFARLTAAVAAQGGVARQS